MHLNPHNCRLDQEISQRLVRLLSKEWPRTTAGIIRVDARSNLQQALAEHHCMPSARMHYRGYGRGYLASTTHSLLQTSAMEINKT